MKQIIICSLITSAIFFAGCAATPQQMQSAAVQGLGSAYGSYVLTKNPSDAYLANYKMLTVKLYHLMDGAMTPADLHLLVQQINVADPNPNAKQAAALSFLGSITGSFVKVNGGPVKTTDGVLAEKYAQTIAVGMAESVGMKTGTNWTPDWNVPANSD